jgi:hypothetical protein
MSSQNDVVVKFKNQPELHIQLDDNPTASAWLELFKKNYQREFPIFRDQKKYTLAYLNQLANKARDELGWDCETNITSLENTVLLHKNLETTLANGFGSIPAIHDELIHELHFCLHKIEFVDLSSNVKNRELLQIEWFNDDGFPLDLDPSFKHTINLNFGDIRLQNPFVGHIPLQIYGQNDTHNIMQTCKFHNFVRPGLCIHAGIFDYDVDLENLEKYVLWWKTNAPEFVALHGIEKILHYTGHPVIGKVINLDDLLTIVNSDNILELEEVICLH